MKTKQVSLMEIAKVFLIIGTVGFGGAGAIIALTQEYCVTQRKWLSFDEFSHGVALGQILGPFAVNTTLFVGYKTRGFKGAMVALLTFLAPSIVMVIILSALYMHFHKIPALQSALNGVSPVVVALILSVTYQMGKNKMKSFEFIFLMLLAIIFSSFLKIQVTLILLAALIYGIIKVFLLKMNGADVR